MTTVDTGLAPGPETTRLAAAASHHRAELDALLAEIEGGIRVLLPTERGLTWRSRAAAGYEARLRELEVRLRAVTAVVEEACEAQRRQATRLRIIADAPGAW